VEPAAVTHENYKVDHIVEKAVTARAAREARDEHAERRAKARQLKEEQGQ